jgi:hypothetical protein
MTESVHAQAAELHTLAAYAHIAADHSSRTNDPVSAEYLSRVAEEYSTHAARLSKDIAQQMQAGPATTEEDAALATPVGQMQR